MEQFIWPIRVYYEDTDAGGVVFYANYLKFFERARTEMLRAKGFEQDELIKHKKVLFAVKTIKVDYVSPARFNEKIDVISEISILKKVSLVFEQTIKRSDTLLCKATVTIACLDSDSMRPKAIPADLIAEFQ